jgi:ornithine decarboxylase
MKIFTTSLLGINISLNNFNNNRWIYDKSALIEQANKWSNNIPWIKPYYAVKSNPLQYMLSDLVTYRSDTHKSFNIGLDVASLKETNTALKITHIENTIYTNPHMIPHEINENLQFNIKVVDSICELELLNKYNIKCPLIIRVNSCVNKANVNFNSKFGATIEEAYEIIELAYKYNYVVKGVSFHIGSGGKFSRMDAFQNTFINNATPILKCIQKTYYEERPILNFGGGFLHDTDLKDALGWTQHLPYRMIAEPGRYFSEPSHHLAVQVIAITNKGIFLDNGVYHELNCFHRDHWTMPKLTHSIHNNKINEIHKYKSSVIFGPTCDSYDTIGQQYFPEDIAIGDWILLPNMGAYTNAGLVEFNGISGASSHIK